MCSFRNSDFLAYFIVSWVSEWVSDCCLTPTQQFFRYIMVNFQWDDDEVHFFLDQHAGLDFYRGSSLKQQTTGTHVTLLGHIILIQSQRVFFLTPKCCVLSGEAENTNFMVFGLTRLGLTIYCTWGEHTNHYTTDAVIS